MFTDLKSALSRSAPTLVQDLAGATALVLILLAGLYLPVMI
ncbi:MAG: hypothetical protein QNJ44_18950 [Rhodobacter sp.]|nr:hypothetical protein [Rhodobacter sp.]